MPTLDEDDPSILFTMLKGEPGTRKSTAALSWPTPQYWFSVDQKMSALHLPLRKWGIDAKQVNYDDYVDWNSIRARLESFQVNCKYRTIIMDSITSIADATNRQTLKAKTGTTTRSGDDKGGSVGGIRINTIEDYKAEASAFNEMTALLKDIKKAHRVNIVLIAHVIGERKPQDAGQQTQFARIICTGGKIISAKIPAYCGEIYQFSVRPNLDADAEDEYGIRTTHAGDDYARTALPLPKEIYFNNNPLYSTYIKPAIDKFISKPEVAK